MRAKPLSEDEQQLLADVKFDAYDDAKSLIENGVDVNVVDECGESILFYVIKKGNQAFTEFLIQQKNADANLTNITNVTVLHKAVRFPEILRFLLDHNSNIDAADDTGFTPMLKAVECKNIESVRILKAHDASVNVKTAVNAHIREYYGMSGFTPLHLASYYGDLKMIALLLEYGADAHATTAEGQTCRDLLRSRHTNHIAEFDALTNPPTVEATTQNPIQSNSTKPWVERKNNATVAIR